jgi:methylmalonyl-CoA mutase cobalamin-binding subunit
MAVRLWKSADVTAFCKTLKDAGYKVVRDTAAGTVKAWHDDEIVFQAIKKGVSNAWICRINDAYIAQ